MIRKLLIGVMAFASTIANAQYIGTLPPNGEFQFSYSKDTDKTYIRQTTVGVSHESGFGVIVGESKFLGQTVSANSALIQGTYVQITDDYEFHGKLGVRQMSFSTNLDKAGEVLATTIIGRTPGLTSTDIADIQQSSPQWAADNIRDAGGKTSGTSQYIAAESELRLTMTDSLTVGLAAATDVVQSERAIQNGITYTVAAVDVDLQMTDHLGLVVVVSETFFSDSNSRFTLKAKVNYDILPEYGIAAYYRLKEQRDLNPGQGNYFSPDHLTEHAIGLSMRKANSGLVYTAFFDYGDQRLHTSSGIDNKPIYTWQIGVQTQPGKRYGNTFGAFLTSSNTSSINTGTAGYHWTGVNTWVKVPLQ